MTALVGLALNLVLLSSRDFGIARDCVLAGLSDIAVPKPTASNDAVRGL